MPIDVPVVVIEAPSTSKASLASLGTARAALDAWAKANDARPIDPPRSNPPLLVPVDPHHDARALRVEKALRDARDEIDRAGAASADDVRALVAVALDEARAHPEDQEAASWVAELLRTLARVEALGGDLEGAASLRDRAEALSPRLLGLSEQEGVTKNAATSPARVDVRFTAIGDRFGAALEVDDVPVAWDQPQSFVEGEHRLRVLQTNGDEVVGVFTARWFSIGTSTTTIATPIDTGVVPCSAEDVARIDVGAAPSCPRWARVRKISANVVEVQACVPKGCDAPVTFAAPVETSPNGPHSGGETSSIWSSGWTWAAIGAAAIGAGALTAWRLGAFDRPSAPPPTWQWEGVK